MSEDRGQRTEDGGQRVSNSEFGIKEKKLKTHMIDRGQRSEVRGQRTEVRRQRSEVRGRRSEVKQGLSN
jgi:hypothetical protein